MIGCFCLDIDTGLGIPQLAPPLTLDWVALTLLTLAAFLLHS